MSAPVVVGAFSIDTATSMIEGPAAYLASDSFKLVIAEIEAGRNVVASYGIAQGGDVLTSLLVAVQTDYAGWRGQQATARQMGMGS